VLDILGTAESDAERDRSTLTSEALERRRSATLRARSAAILSYRGSSAILGFCISALSYITPETIASGVLAKVNAAFKPHAGEVGCLAPLSGVRQFPATGFNDKKHIEEMKVPTPKRA
jgi:hypothetical protein